MTFCQARILDEERKFIIPGTTESCHTTKECGATGFKKIVIDDGDAFFTICTKCFSRFLTKGARVSTWYGWFDCEYPPEAHVKGSVWWRETVRRGFTALAVKEDPEVEALINEIDEILSQSGQSEKSEQARTPNVDDGCESITSEESIKPPPKPASKKEMLEGRIAELSSFLKSPVKKTQKEVVTATRDIMKCKTELKLLK